MEQLHCGGHDVQHLTQDLEAAFGPLGISSNYEASVQCLTMTCITPCTTQSCHPPGAASDVSHSATGLLQQSTQRYQPEVKHVS